MLTAEAHISTDYASRYLTRLCRHAGKMSRPLNSGHSPRSHHATEEPASVVHVEWSDTIGTIGFGEGQCILQASDSALLLRVEASTESGLRRLQDGLAHRLETFGHREHLTVHWQPSTFPPTVRSEEFDSGVPASDGHMKVWWQSRLARNLVLAAASAVVIAAHLGLLGAALSASEWTKWGVAAVLAAIALKFIAAVGGHLAGGAFAIRRGRAFFTARKQRHDPS